MQPTTWVFMVLVLGVLWGGFAALLLVSMRAEKRRPEASPVTGGADRD